MTKERTLLRIMDLGIIAVLRAENEILATKMVHAIVKGGMKAIELTFSTPNVDQVVRQLKAEDESLLLGVGTVLDAVSARIAIFAGADFIVSPSFDIETAQLCNLYRIPYLPGCVSMTEITTALRYGVDIIKLFPGSLVGPDYIKAVKAPLPQVNIMPTGGVNFGNIDQWFAAGAVAVGIGGALSTVEGDDFASLTQLAQQYTNRLHEIRGK
ncbi:bifunctional 2-keto-4-hydroxyglutarate aldolase/2-keto-3-deoxy-6-phosphogluconate aldolase [Streptococcus merionis]|uniref:Keto-hydroxyglutarate-aldolase/keto-deoxy-phosphogluconate aldolase n=1 Tax=Streptococcus merionis TaxID=400065 RepID=A0A239SWM9_9STRE|nr:bifunctional 2-keto-4-hydroxyglutarate aldolase/2-keto-3-deoxy-6-phosphogluconate aldolase [Streptococcus merionis]SNU89248.1 keto-hydroxyglutarate-aldolase/keto-deoxy-phosphogluconate aldolase [Streptococcus merionis]